MLMGISLLHGPRSTQAQVTTPRSFEASAQTCQNLCVSAVVIPAVCSSPVSCLIERRQKGQEQGSEGAGGSLRSMCSFLLCSIRIARVGTPVSAAFGSAAASLRQQQSLFVLYVCIYIYIYTHTYIHISLSQYIYIYIERERDIAMPHYVYSYIYIYISEVKRWGFKGWG